MIFFSKNATILVCFKTINKDNSYFFRNTRLSFDIGPVPPKQRGTGCVIVHYRQYIEDIKTNFVGFFFY